MAKQTSTPNTEPNIKKKRIFASFFSKVASVYRAHPNAYMLWTFVLPFLLMLGIYIGMSVFPFGNRTVLTLDLNGQYVYFFEALRDWIYGEGSMLYSFSRALGGEFMGIYTYYLASPLSYIVALFPKRMMPEALFLMLLIKGGLSGLTFGYFIKKTSSSSKTQTVVFSVLYAMSGYAIVMQHNTMWTDCLILLPLLALSIRDLIRERKYKLFTFSLALSILSNFYIGYMTCIFVLVYFFCCYFSMTPEERNPRKVKFNLIRSTASVAIFSAIAIGIAMIVILPSYYSLSFGKNEFSTPTFDFSTKFDLVDMLTKMFFGSYDTVRPEGLPFVYCGTIVLFLLPLFFASSKISPRHKGAVAAMMLIIIMSFNINALNLIWHGFQNPNWLNYRESYMLIFIMLVAANEAFSHLKEATVGSICGIGACLSLLLLLFQELEYEYLNDWYSILAGIVIIGIYVLCICLALKVKKRSFEFACTLLGILICFEGFGGGMLNLGELFMDVGYAYRDGYVGFFDKWQGAVDYVKDNDDGFYRMEKTVTRKVNDPYALGYNGLSGSTSTLNVDTIEFLSHMGLSSRSHWTEYVKNGNIATNSLLSLEYLLTENGETVSSLYEYYYNDEEVAVYHNPYSLGIAFGSSEDIRLLTFKEYEFDENDKYIDDGKNHVDSLSPFKKINAIYSAILGEEANVFSPLNYSKIDYEGVSPVMIAGHRKFSKSSNAENSSVTLTLNVKQNGEIYFYIPATYRREVDLYLNGEEFGSYFTNGSHAVISLGEYSMGDTVTLEMKLCEDDLYLGTGVDYFFYLEEEIFLSATNKIQKSSLNISEHSPTYFKGQVTLTADTPIMLTTIPYDKGWKVWVDGTEVETFEATDALLAFEVGAGDHTVELSYEPECVTIGGTISIISCGIFVLIIGGEWLINKKKKSSIQIKQETN